MVGENYTIIPFSNIKDETYSLVSEHSVGRFASWALPKLWIMLHGRISRMLYPDMQKKEVSSGKMGIFSYVIPKY